MNYSDLLKRIAQHFHTTPEEAEDEIKKAIAATGYDISPEVFISLCVAKIKNNTFHGNGKY